MNYKSFKQIFLILFLISCSIVSQSKQEIEKMTKEYDLIKLDNFSEKYANDFYAEKEKALLMAAQKGWKLKYTDSKGSHYGLIGVTKQGKPLYYKTYNADAAISTRANFLHNNGGLGLNIEGQGMTAHVWDFGIPRETHQEYDGVGGENRVSVGDGTTELGDHAAHVMGTIISSGFESAAKGMAPQAKGVAYSYENDLSTATATAADGMLISNHSYGFSTRDDDGNPSLPAFFFGGYIDESRNWDNIMFNAPYYLMVVAAGNEGNDEGINLEPLQGNFLFDKLTGQGTSKNGLVVANGQDAAINADGSLNTVERNSSSTEGPTDDLRVKPDIMGNGTGVYSTLEAADDAYASYSGTSMASPNVAGSLLLLQQYYKEKNGTFMKAATLKGLALHTADDVAAIGPDADTGWGLMNTKKAAETITTNNFQSIISEIEITQGSTYTLVVKSDGVAPLLASISWTDAPGVANTGVVNDATPVLVNDIDIRITNNSEDSSEIFMPWKLTSVVTNEKGDNIVDPYEKVEIQNALGEYTITISHKGTLAGESQNVSLIVTGVTSGIGLFTSENAKTSCGNTTSFDLNYVETIGGTTTFSVEGQPTNATVNLSDTSLSADGALTVTFGNLDNVLPGSYPINITGKNGNEITTTPIELNVIEYKFSGEEVVPAYPENGLTGITTSKVNLSWEKYTNAKTYLVEVSESPTFNSISFSENSDDLQFSIEGLQSETVYYWRIKPENTCISGDYSSINSFQTGISECPNTYVATDFSMAKIDTIAGSRAFVPINVTDTMFIDKILVTTDINHSYVQDIIISLEGPESIGSTQVVLLQNPCGEIANISNVTFDDDANPLNCNNIAPAISGPVKPINNMSAPYTGKNALGEWKLIVDDGWDLDGGQINAASISICTVQKNTNIPSLALSDIIVDKNSTYTITSSDISASTTDDVATNQIFTLVSLPTKGYLEIRGVQLSLGDQFDQHKINAGFINYVNTQTDSFSDEFKVDVTNSSKGWLPNKTINIREATLSLEKNVLEEISLWPNPTKGILNIKINNVNNEDVKISLLDLQGRQISTSINKVTNAKFTKEIETRNISAGVYLLRIQQGNKKATKKIIVSK
ncbi:S8 family serine peptidase [Polaribacter litorisediminis]|uniref:S8 family serine peptidase n=1 Tax=Polaribacter litorisediminis TaxID=1908341 RepID=UPI001CC1190A|nr:S8 family serine peptidase [Polaribacter litorisediminis]UAM97727.1 S8 family serine peptidase [Polaribacter litorisediminis]